MAFHGIMHEVIGPLLFPWAPPLFGAVVWHGMGIGVLVLGLLVWAASLGLLRFPVVATCAAVACLALGVIVFFIAAHGEFHFFAMCLGIAAATAACFHRLAARARGTLAS